ncbi:MAG TPA: cytochrome c family protein [Devosia sp.]|jgi:cytochrome c|nr:cytochrome c family protein [Devosia sp.]
MKSLALAALVLVAAAGPSLAAGDAAAGKTVFAKCAVCHNIGPNATNKIGPALTGVVGRQPGTAAGFTYSAAMKDFGTKNPAWTPELLAKFLQSPKTEVPGTKMTFAGLSNQTDVDNVIAYLQSGG